MGTRILHNIIIGSMLSAGLLMSTATISAQGRRPMGNNGSNSRSTTNVGSRGTTNANSNTSAGRRPSMGGTSSNNNSGGVSRPSGNNNRGSGVISNRPTSGRWSDGSTSTASRPAGNGSGKTNESRPSIVNRPTSGSTNNNNGGSSSGNRPGNNGGVTPPSNGNHNGNYNGNNGNNGNHNGNYNGNNNSGRRPGYNGTYGNNGGVSRPSTNPNHWPDNNRGGVSRPGNGNNYGPSRPHTGVSRPSRPSSWNTYVAPPVRPYRPAYRPMPRPVVPASWRPYRGAPIINGILGITFGTIYANTLDYLYDRDYIIDGYTADAVYLRDVRQLVFNWPDVILNYAYGRLSAAQFIYSSSYYDRVRYDRVYDELCRTYGYPVTSRNSGMTYETVWYGGSREGMVSLTYYREGNRYYTILSYGRDY